MDLWNSEDDCSFTETDVDSESEEFDSDHQIVESNDSVQTLLKFAENISRQVTSYFQRNVGKEDFCDVYEDKFSAPKSGSYSYYTDLLAVAQIGDNNKEEALGRNPGPPDGTKPCDWTCTGFRNEALGAGPFEDLFRVLDAIPETSKNVAVYQQQDGNSTDCLQQRGETNIFPTSAATAFYSAVDSFPRWPSTNFPQYVPSILEEFHTFDENVYLSH